MTIFASFPRVYRETRTIFAHHTKGACTIGRPAQLWLRKSDGYYCVTRGGRKLRLSRDRKEAEAAFHRLLLDGRPVPSARHRPQFREVADGFLVQSEPANSPDTFAIHRRYLQSFCDHVKDRRVPDLRPGHVAAWLAAHPAWGQSTRSLAVQTIKSAINWAVGEGLAADNPLKGVKAGPIGRRERLLTDPEVAAIKGATAGTGFGDFLLALELTGMRPFSEAATITASMVDWRAGTITFAKHKNARKGKKRVAYCPPELLALLRRLADRHPTGPLFRNNNGGAWARQTAFSRLRVLEKATGVKGVTPYAFRHAFITNAIVRGVPMPLVAELVGNSVAIIMRNYSHVDQRGDALKAAALKAIG